MDFEDDRELTTDPDMKDIYFLQPDPPKTQRRGLGLIGSGSDITTSRQMKSKQQQPLFEE